MLGRKNDTKQGHFDWKIIGCLLHTFFDDLCKKAFPDILTLSLHERVFAAETYKCSLCEKTFKMKSVLQSHVAHIVKRHFLISYFEFAWRNVFRWSLISAVFVRWCLRLNQLCNHTLDILQKGISWYPYFNFAWKNVRETLKVQSLWDDI